MKYKFLEKPISYDGSQLRSLFGYMEHGVLGDSIVAFTGPCNVTWDHMVDGEDLRAQSPIRGQEMLHFIIEEFGQSLELAVTRQRLFATIVKDLLMKQSGKNIDRNGDDLFYGEGKLSISIATVSPVSALIHFALNITNKGTPVRTASFEDLGIESKRFADSVSESYIQEVKTIKEACCKVKWVK